MAFKAAEMPILVAGALATTIVSLLIWKMMSPKPVYIKVGRVLKLLYYPVKSLKAIEVPEIECSSTAVKSYGIWDRSFMLMSGEHVMISQRQEPRLVLLGISTCENGIVITNSEGKVLKVNVKTTIDEHDDIVTCKVHDYIAPTIDCGDEAAKFFQDYLGRDDVRLVQFMHTLPSRKYAGKFHLFKELLPDKLAFQDNSPVNILSQPSIDDLNTRLEKKVSVYNFRPNVLVEGCEPYAEDTWTSIKFSGGAVIGRAVPCTRCVLTTVDPETGIKTNKDPLVTLRKFRMLKDKELSKALNHSPAFSVHGWISEPGKIAVGDDVYAIVEKRTLVLPS